MASGGVPLLGGYEYEFVAELPDDWECLVCQLPLKDPVQIEGCGHRLCEICIGTILSLESPQCPADREPISRDRIFSDVACHRRILDAHVRCPNKGCSWKGELRDVKVHEADCLYEAVQCVNTGCEEKVIRKDIISHVESTCLWTVVHCAFCSARFPKMEKKTHNEACENFPVECSNKCGLKNIPRQELRHHVEVTCPLAVIDCEFSTLGCAIKMQRRDAQAHMEALKDTHLHLSCKSLVQMSKIIQQQSLQITRLEEKLERCENSPFIWKIPNFASVMEAAIKEGRRAISGGPFYSAPNGYRFELELYPYGYNTGDPVETTDPGFMSLYMRVLVGEYDGVLIWPFKDYVLFTLLDQSESPVKRRHFRRSVLPDPQGLTRPTEGSQEACGLWQFVFHDELYSRSYIKDDVIFIKVAFVDQRGRKSSTISRN